MDSSQRARKSYKYINQFSVIMSVGNLLLIHSTTTTKQQQNNNKTTTTAIKLTKMKQKITVLMAKLQQ